MTWHVSPEEWLLDFTSVPRGRPRAESLDAIDDRLRLMLAPPAPQPALIMPSITGAGRQPPRPPAPPPARASAPEPGRVREPSRPVPEARSAEPEAARPETALIMPNLSSEPRPEPGPSVLDVQIVSLTATPAPTIPPPVNAADLVIPTLTRSGFDLDVDDDEASALDRLDPVSGPELGIPADDADDLMSAMAASTPMLTSPPTPAPTRPEEVLEEPEEVEEHELEAEPLEEHEPAAEEVEERAPEKRAPAAPERPTSAPEKRAPERPLTAEKPPEKAPERPPTQPERAAPVLDKPTPPRPPPVADKPVPPPPPTEKPAAPAAEKAAPPPPPAADKPTPPPPPTADRPLDKPAPPPPPGEKAGPPSPPKPATVPPPLAKPPAPASKPAAAPVAAAPVAAAAAAAAAQAGRKRNWFDEAFGDHYGSITPLDADASAELDAAFIRKTAELGAGQSLLDVACGDGRHCFALANLGLMVSGLDCSLAQLVRASQRNEATEAGVTLLHGDMRSLPRDRQYDIVTCLGSSLGYFESDDQNRQCIQELVEVLRPGGKLVLHTFNRDYLVAVLPCRSWWQGRGCLVLDVADMNYFTNRVRIHRTVVFEDGRQFEHHMYIRMFSLHELGKILTSLGMRVLEVSGSRDTRGRFYGATSAEIWIVAQRRDDV